MAAAADRVPVTITPTVDQLTTAADHLEGLVLEHLREPDGPMANLELTAATTFAFADAAHTGAIVYAAAFVLVSVLQGTLMEVGGLTLDDATIAARPVLVEAFDLYRHAVAALDTRPTD